MGGSSWLQPTSGEAEPAWMPSDGTRSTYDLVETCIVTLLLCSWTSIHLDIPGKKHRASHMKGIWQKVQWTLKGILFPELILWMAFAELWEARTLCFNLEKVAANSESQAQRQVLDVEMTASPVSMEDSELGISPFSAFHNPATIDTDQGITAFEPSGPAGKKTHSSQNRFTNTDFEKSASSTTRETPGDSQKPTRKRSIISRLLRLLWQPTEHAPFWPIYPARLEVGFFIEMGGLEIDDKTPPLECGSHGLRDNSGNMNLNGRLTSSGALFMAREGLLPHINLARIKDQSKSDLLTKVLVCIQASWMVMQCIARDLTGLPITLLELNTVMHVMCALLIYGMWFKKPQDVRVPEIISPEAATKNLGPSDIDELRTLVESQDQSGGVELSKSRTSTAELSTLIGAILGLITSGIYGGVHLTVWHGHFPTRLERVLWRVSSCIIVGMPAFLIIFLILLSLVRKFATEEEGLGKWDYTVSDGWIYESSNPAPTSSKEAGGFFVHEEGSVDQGNNMTLAADTRQNTHATPKSRKTESSKDGQQGQIDPKKSWWRNLYEPHSKFLRALVEERKWIISVVYIVLVGLQTAATILYLGARAFVVLEAFASLRSLPKGAYQKVNWVELVPHF